MESANKRTNSTTSLEAITNEVTDMVNSVLSSVQNIKELETRLKDEYEKAQQDLEAQRLQFQKDVDDFEQSRKHVEESIIPSSEYATLNVGGRMFSIRPEVGSKYPNSFFGALFSDRWQSKRGADGSIFIDRSGTHFHHIADFLRNDEFLADLSETDSELLCREAAFYVLSELVDILKPKTVIKKSHEYDFNQWTTDVSGSVSNGGQSVENISLNYESMSIGFRGFLGGTIHWAIRIELKDEFDVAKIGICLDNVKVMDSISDLRSNRSIAYASICKYGIEFTGFKWDMPKAPPIKFNAVETVLCTLDFKSKKFLIGVKDSLAHEALDLSPHYAGSYRPFVLLRGVHSKATFL